MYEDLEIPAFLRCNRKGDDMPETAVINHTSGAKLPDLSKEGQISSNGPDRDEFLFMVGQIKRADDEITEKRTARKKLRQHFSNRGVNLAMMDLAIAEAEREDGTTISNMRDLKRYYEFMGLPIGHQFQLFDGPLAAAADIDIMARAFTEGRERGIKGEFPDEQKWLPVSPEGQEHQRGWGEGQAVHLAKIKGLSDGIAADERAEAEARTKREAKKKAKAAKASDGEDADDQPPVH